MHVAPFDLAALGPLPDDTLLTREHAAAFCNVSERMFDDLRREWELPHVQIGPTGVRFSGKDLRAMTQRSPSVRSAAETEIQSTHEGGAD